MKDEPAACRIQSVLAEAAASDGAIISAVNWCELLYVIRRVQGVADAALAAARFQEVPISVIDADADQASLAAALKLEFDLGLGDSFAAALALSLDAPLLTGDRDFEPLAARGLRVEWAG